MDFQTNLYVVMKNQVVQVFKNVHPDNTYRIENGVLSFETEHGEHIYYVPAEQINYFYTKCERA